MKTALITGISGQDGAYLTQLLLEKDYKVYGAYRRTSSVNFWRMEGLGVTAHPNLELVEYDLTDPGCSLRLIEKAQPDEDRKSTRLNSSHPSISYAVFCLKKKSIW